MECRTGPYTSGGSCLRQRDMCDPDDSLAKLVAFWRGVLQRVWKAMDRTKPEPEQANKSSSNIGILLRSSESKASAPPLSSLRAWPHLQTTNSLLGLWMRPKGAVSPTVCDSAPGMESLHDTLAPSPHFT